MFILKKHKSRADFSFRSSLKVRHTDPNSLLLLKRPITSKRGVIRGLMMYNFVVVQFYHWFKFYFLLFQTHYHILP